MKKQIQYKKWIKKKQTVFQNYFFQKNI